MKKDNKKQKELEINGQKKNSNGKKLQIFLIIFSAVLAIIFYPLYKAYDNYINRPQLTFKINSFSIGESLTKCPNLKVVLNQVNSGKSDAMYTITRCNVYFPLVSNDPMNIAVNKSLTLKSNTNITDTTTINIPLDFENINFLKYDSLKFIELVVEELRTKKIYNIQRNYNELVLIIRPEKTKKYAIIYFKDESGKIIGQLDPRLYEFLEINPKTGDQVLKYGIHKITYKGKTYNNAFYPVTARVVHKIVKDKIKIGYDLGSFSSGKSGQNFVLLPDSAIADLIELPEYNSIITSYTDTINNKIIYKNVNFNIKENIYGNSYYFLFEE